MKGMVMTAEEGGADRERRARRLTKEAISAAGRSLFEAIRFLSSDRSPVYFSKDLR
jgi:hypothetical protein